MTVQWTKLMDASAVQAHKGARAQVGDLEIAVFCIDGKYYAIKNVCPHRGAPLHEGELSGSIVTCPWHAWEFDLVTGKSPINPAACVATYPVKQENDAIWVQL